MSVVHDRLHLIDAAACGDMFDRGVTLDEACRHSLVRVAPVEPRERSARMRHRAWP